ncbi:hypothetical protein H0H87_000174 [Tephrocybe sp. NHM501043]|nr:hypothetical protein H0H87_000174 [Tephrocybe sp. NHM501043]
MPSITRTILIAFHVAAFTGGAVAAPLARSTALSPPEALSPRNYSRTLPRSMRIVRNLTYSVPASARAFSIEPSQPAETAVAASSYSTANPYFQLAHYHQAAKQNTKNLKRLAAQSTAAKANDVAFQKKCTNQLKTFHTNVLMQQATISAIQEAKHSSPKGLANYDKDSSLETLLKDIINLHKEALTATYVLAKNLPILGPVLGPNTLLNSSQELVDGLLNDLLPPIRKLLGLPL